uniref:Uncharacterized protein n=1 Tax=Leptobrachium leishanense TaxID=445787 RepID=A0A8C5WLW5_9ANUR
MTKKSIKVKNNKKNTHTKINRKTVIPPPPCTRQRSVSLLRMQLQERFLYYTYIIYFPFGRTCQSGQNVSACSSGST